MTIEKEALEIVRRGGSDQFPDPGTAVYIIGKALKAKQDRIGYLEERLREYKNEWESACERERATNERVQELELKLAEYHDAYEGKKHRIYELESALKELVEASKVAYTPKFVQSYAMKSLLKAFDRAKKAIGGGK